MTNDTAATVAPEKVQLATRIRGETNDRLSRMSEISGMPKSELVDRAIEAFEPRVIEAAKALSATQTIQPASAEETQQAQPA